MFKEFNVKFEDAELIGGADNLLEGTKVTKVVLRGDNKLSSLNSMLKNCSQLDTIDGYLNLDGINNIDSLLEGTTFVTKVDFINVNNKNLSANNSIPYVNQVSIGGETYDKEAIQNLIGSREWTFDNISYNDRVKENIKTNILTVLEGQENLGIISNALEQKAKSIEIEGQTYENLINGEEEVLLVPDIKLEIVNGENNTFELEVECPAYIRKIEGQTYKDNDIMQGVGELQEDGTYKITISTDNGYEKLWEEL